MILFTILQVQIGDVRMVLADVRDGVEVAGGEMADIEVHLEVLRHLHGGGEAVRRGEFVRIVDLGVAVHRDDHPMLLGERLDTFCNIERRRRGDDARAQRLRHLESAVDLGVGEARVRTVVVRVDRNAGGIELFLDGAEMIERPFDAPFAKVLARLLCLRGRTAAAGPTSAGIELRLGLRGEQLTLGEAACNHRLDDRVDSVAAWGPRQVAEAVGLHPNPHAIHGGVGGCRHSRSVRASAFAEATADHRSLGGGGRPDKTRER